MPSEQAVGDSGEAALPAIDERRWARICWRCRRGLLENDIVLTRYLDAVADRRVGEPELQALDRLLDMNDNALWDLLSGRAESEDEEVQRLACKLRSF